MTNNDKWLEALKSRQLKSPSVQLREQIFTTQSSRRRHWLAVSATAAAVVMMWMGAPASHAPGIGKIGDAILIVEVPSCQTYWKLRMKEVLK